MRRSRKSIRKAIENIEPKHGEVAVESEVHTIHDSDDLDSEIPEGATIMSTESDMVTVYETD